MLNCRCAYCGSTKFSSWKEYTEHMRTEEVSYRKKIVTSPEDKKSIIRRIEEKLKGHIIGTDHATSCRCEDCFNMHLDSMLDRSNTLMGV